jgi:hypothetical protein
MFVVVVNKKYLKKFVFLCIATDISENLIRILWKETLWFCFSCFHMWDLWLYSHGFCFSTYLDHINLFGAMFCSTYSVMPIFCNLHFDPVIVILVALAMTLTFQIVFSLRLSHCFGKEMVVYIVSSLGHCYKCGICVPFIFICRKYIQSNFLEIQSLEKGSLKTRTML